MFRHNAVETIPSYCCLLCNNIGFSIWTTDVSVTVMLCPQHNHDNGCRALCVVEFGAPRHAQMYRCVTLPSWKHLTSKKKFTKVKCRHKTIGTSSFYAITFLYRKFPILVWHGILANQKSRGRILPCLLKFQSKVIKKIHNSR